MSLLSLGKKGQLIIELVVFTDKYVGCFLVSVQWPDGEHLNLMSFKPVVMPGSRHKTIFHNM